MAWREAKIRGKKSDLHDKCTTENENTLLINRLIGCFAVRTGLEPATSAVTGRHSNQLNYRTMAVMSALFSNAVQR